MVGHGRHGWWAASRSLVVALVALLLESRENGVLPLEISGGAEQWGWLCDAT